jgi:transcription factor E
MQLKFLKKLAEQVAGIQSVKIVELLFDKKDVNEFLIAKKLGLTINQTRNILYKLSNIGMISSIRKKDKRKGWYIYFWTLDVEKALEIVITKLEEEIGQLNKQLLSKKTKRFYVCKTCNIEVSEENALLCSFACTECGDVFDLSDNEPIIKATSTTIERTKKELEIAEQELSKIKQIQEKKLRRFIEKEKKEKAEKRRAARKKTERAKKKTEGAKKGSKAVKGKKKKQAKKKPVKKKPVKGKQIKKGVKSKDKKKTAKVKSKPAKKTAKKSNKIKPKTKNKAGKKKK